MLFYRLLWSFLSIRKWNEFNKCSYSFQFTIFTYSYITTKNTLFISIPYHELRTEVMATLLKVKMKGKTPTKLGGIPISGMCLTFVDIGEDALGVWTVTVISLTILLGIKVSSTVTVGQSEVCNGIKNCKEKYMQWCEQVRSTQPTCYVSTIVCQIYIYWIYSRYWSCP